MEFLVKVGCSSNIVGSFIWVNILGYEELQKQLADLQLECESLKKNNDELQEKLPQVSNIIHDVCNDCIPDW